MESRSRRERGQALIESIFSVTLVTLVISLAVSLVIEMRRLFKHDYVSRPVEAPPADIPVTPIDELTKKIMFFEKGSDARNLRKLTDDGWAVERNFKTSEHLYHLLVKDGQRMIFSNSIGVNLCSANCSSN